VATAMVPSSTFRTHERVAGSKVNFIFSMESPKDRDRLGVLPRTRTEIFSVSPTWAEPEMESFSSCCVPRPVGGKEFYTSFPGRPTGQAP
jgi:hypothetical protein